MNCVGRSKYGWSEIIAIQQQSDIDITKDVVKVILISPKVPLDTFSMQVSLKPGSPSRRWSEFETSL